MHNLSIVQEAWLAAGAPMGDPDICLDSATDFISVCYPDIGSPGYLVLSLRGVSREFGTFAEAMDFASRLIVTE